MKISEKIIGNSIIAEISDSKTSIRNSWKFYSNIFLDDILNIALFRDGIDKFFKGSEERICKISLNNNYLENRIKNKKKFETENIPEHYMINEDISTVPHNGKHKWKITITEDGNCFEIIKETSIPVPERITKAIKENDIVRIVADEPTIISRYYLKFKGNNFRGKIQDCPKEYIEEISNKAIELLEKSEKYLNLNFSTFINIKKLIKENKNRIIYSIKNHENDNLFFEKNESVLEKSNMEKFAIQNLECIKDLIE